MSHRPLVFVSGLTVGDYLLWNWSLNSSHDVLALASGLTLPPLSVACLWLAALSLTRLIAHGVRASGARARRDARASARQTGSALRREEPARTAVSAQEAQGSPSAGAPSRKIAA